LKVSFSFPFQLSTAPSLSSAQPLQLQEFARTTTAASQRKRSGTLSLTFRWISLESSARPFEIPAFDLRGLDFLFVIAFLLGQYALHRLLAVKEEGEVEEERVVNELYGEVRKAVRHVSNVAGLRQLTYFPYAIVRKNASRGDDDR
jgi:hypothetical protein